MPTVFSSSPPPGDRASPAEIISIVRRVPLDPVSAYLDLLMRTLTRYDMGDDRFPARGSGRVTRRVVSLVDVVLRRRGLELTRVVPFDPAARAEGRDWPSEAETMVGLRRLENIRSCVSAVVEDGVPGDVLEAGVWRGGAAIFTRAALDALGGEGRIMWLADSFEGLPPPDPGVPADQGDRHSEIDYLAVGIEGVKANFAKYGLLDDRVRFLQGWFVDTLPDARMERLAILRADGDMYKSTMDILTALYAKVSPGGFVIIDDYGAIPGCRLAVDEFRRDHGVAEPLTLIDWTGVYWRKQ